MKFLRNDPTLKQRRRELRRNQTNMLTQALVRVDGVSLGQVNYGLNWPALAQVFSVSIYPYSENAAYAYSLNTTQFSNGQHALDVVAIDELGNLSGIGSRYIYIQN